MRRVASRGAVLAVTVALARAGDLQAAGFALKEQSPGAQGNAFAGATAGGDDLSLMFFNPAALGGIDEVQLQAVATAVAPRAELDNASGSTVTATTIGGTGHNSDIATDAVLPAFYAALPLPGRVTLGLAVNVPFGLETNYPDEWVGRYHAVKSDLKTVNINPAFAWRATDWLSLGGGFQAQYADGTLTNAIDFGTIGAAAGVPGAAPAQQDGFSRLHGDDWAYGWDAGLIVEPLAGTRVGVAYRSQIKHTLRGEVDFTGDDAGIADILRRSTGAFTDSDASLGLTTPASLSIGLHQDVTPKLALLAEAQWTDWSVFDQLIVEFDNPNQPDSVTEEEWHDTWFLALGTTYAATDEVTLRAGVALDQSPVKDKYRTPRIPDENRYWLSAGIGWKPAAWLDLDAALTYIWLEDSEVDLAAADEGSTFRGDLQADYESNIVLVGLSARMRF